MIRKRFKSLARRTAIKMFKMEFDTEEREQNTKRVDPSQVDLSKIPKLVDGDGDTPGPNHKEDIGRTWVSAQLVGGVAPCFVDTRPLAELEGGILPKAQVQPGEQILQHLDGLPTDRQARVVVYDATGEQGASALAERLRQEGWTMARQLKGGFAEWIEHDEPIEQPPQPTGAPVPLGGRVRLKDGREVRLLRCEQENDQIRLTLMDQDGKILDPMGADALEI